MEQNVPFDVQEDSVDTGSLEDVTGKDTLPASPNVRFAVKNAKFQYSNAEGNFTDNPEEVTKKDVSFQFTIVDGINENGAYKNKVMFHKATVWNSQAKGRNYLLNWKLVLKALGYDTKNPPKASEELFSEFTGKEFVADIQKKLKSVRQPDGTWKEGTEPKNVLNRFRAVE